jgi:hypothetical protein
MTAEKKARKGVLLQVDRYRMSIVNTVSRDIHMDRDIINTLIGSVYNASCKDELNQHIPCFFRIE